MDTAAPDIWIWVGHSQGHVTPRTLGLFSEAERLLPQYKTDGRITAVIFGADTGTTAKNLAGADRIICVEDDRLDHYHGELFARIFADMVIVKRPTLILMAQDAETADLAPRLAALTASALVTRAMDFNLVSKTKANAVRPHSNDYLFETLEIDCEQPPVICFHPSVLNPPEPGKTNRDALCIPYHPKWKEIHLKTRLVEVTRTSGAELPLSDAEIVVAVGRGVGNGETFRMVQELADLLDGPLGGTRPVIDTGHLSYDRQIGQTGATIAPKLLVNIGISGANEYTAGIEQSKTIIAINPDEQSRIFNFTDLGLVGNAEDILPEVIDRIRQLTAS